VGNVGVATVAGIELSELAALRLTLLRQYQKYEHTRADALAALEAGRWRLAGLSARACLGFALDVARAANGHAHRDEVSRLGTLSQVLHSTSLRNDAARLLTSQFSAEDVAEYLTECLTFIDTNLQTSEMGLPAYYYGSEREAHVECRNAWLRVARACGAKTTYSDSAADQLLSDPAQR
jgi:hypothetical protein